MIVVNSEGSSPGRPGFKMLVSSTGDLNGSIGGGIMEYNLVEQARKKLKEKDLSINIIRQFHNDESYNDRSGMICSGSQTMTLIPLIGKDQEIIYSILESIKDLKDYLLHISPNGLIIIPGKRNDKNNLFLFNNEMDWYYEENLNQKDLIYIIGGGHVGLALSRIMSILNFYIIVIDNRPEIDTIKKNNYANEKIIVSYDSIENYIKEGDNNYVVIMTFGHEADELILRKLMNKRFRYLGMMGSPQKIKQIFDNLINDEIPEEELNIVHAPIGIQINSHTPEEIAISIAAEIIKIKNSK
jgi:xanthine dehydrogenase accessory factor